MSALEELARMLFSHVEPGGLQRVKAVEPVNIPGKVAAWEVVATDGTLLFVMASRVDAMESLASRARWFLEADGRIVRDDEEA